jgi:hypothetical protein
VKVQLTDVVPNASRSSKAHYHRNRSAKVLGAAEAMASQVTRLELEVKTFLTDMRAA